MFMINKAYIYSPLVNVFKLGGFWVGLGPGAHLKCRYKTELCLSWSSGFAPVDDKMCELRPGLRHHSQLVGHIVLMGEGEAGQPGAAPYQGTPVLLAGALSSLHYNLVKWISFKRRVR